jgi:hypothetical protein
MESLTLSEAKEMSAKSFVLEFDSYKEAKIREMCRQVHVSISLSAD